MVGHRPHCSSWSIQIAPVTYQTAPCTCFTALPRRRPPWPGASARARAWRTPLGVAASTLRWHLQRVFEKTGTARQAELARLVERLGTLGGNEDRG